MARRDDVSRGGAGQDQILRGPAHRGQGKIRGRRIEGRGSGQRGGAEVHPRGSTGNVAARGDVQGVGPDAQRTQSIGDARAAAGQVRGNRRRASHRGVVSVDARPGRQVQEAAVDRDAGAGSTRAAALPSFSVPELSVVPPVKVLVPERAQRPLPVFTSEVLFVLLLSNDRAPGWCWPRCWNPGGSRSWNRLPWPCWCWRK